MMLSEILIWALGIERLSAKIRPWREDDRISPHLEMALATFSGESSGLIIVNRGSLRTFLANLVSESA